MGRGGEEVVREGPNTSISRRLSDELTPQYRAEMNEIQDKVDMITDNYRMTSVQVENRTAAV